TVQPVLTFLPSFPGPQNVYAQAADTVNGQTGSWQGLGTYTAATPLTTNPPQAPTSISGTGMSGTFTFRATDGNGYAYIPQEQVAFMPAGTTGSGAGGCNVLYYRAENALFLMTDDGTGYLWPPLTPGTPGTKSNLQCTIDSSAAQVGNGTQLDLPVTIT